MRTYMRTGTHEFFLENICNICICITLALWHCKDNKNLLDFQAFRQLLINLFRFTEQGYPSLVVNPLVILAAFH